MGESNKHIVIIDDEPYNILSLSELLEEQYTISTFNSGEAAIDEIKLTPPDLILLEMNLPDTNGIDVCSALRENADFDHIPIIFLTSTNSEAERIAGYEAGANDCIIRPFSDNEVLAKIKLALGNQFKIDEQKQLASNNMQMAMTLMSQNGETGHVLNFLKDSFLCKSIAELNQKLLDTCAAYDLKVTVRPNTAKNEYFTHDAELKSIDAQILETLHTQERLIYFGHRCIVNFKNISLLIKNMPIDDDEKNGRLKDHLALIMEGADARMVSLKNEEKLANRESGLSQMLTSTQKVLSEIDSGFNENAKKNSTIMSELAKKIEWSFVQLDLSDEQETTLISIIESAVEDSSSLYQTGLNIEGKITQLTSELSGIMSSK